MGAEGLLAFGGEGELRSAEIGDESAEKRHDVLGTLPQRRDPEREDGEPVIQIFAEATFLGCLAQIAVCRGKDAHVDGDRQRATEAGDFPLLEDAEELRLQIERQFANLVEEERSFLRLLEAARAARGRAGVGALLGSEQLALEELRRNRGAVHRHEAALATRRQVERARHALLARARLALDEDEGIGRSDTGDDLAQFRDRGALADQVSWLRQFLAEALALFFQIAQGDRVHERGEEALGRGRFLDEVGGAELQRLRRFAGGGAARQHHDGRRERPGKAREQGEPAFTRQAEVEDDGRRRIAKEDFVRLRRGGRCFRAISLVAEETRDPAEHGRIVVDEQDAAAHGCAPPRGSSTTACAPRPSRGSRRSVPPCSWTIFCAMGSPRPDPWGFVVPSDRKSCAPSSRAGIPAPLSRTSTRALWPSARAVISTGPSPGREASSAFLMRLPNARRS